MKKLHTVYGLTDEFGLIRYVGQTLSLQTRFTQHARNKRLPFTVAGMAILSEAPTTGDANEAEKKWIAFFGKDNLCNVLEGGMYGLRTAAMTGQELRLWRQSRRLTMEKLGRLLNVTQKTVFCWETGRSSTPTFIREALDDLSQKLQEAS